MPYKNPEHKRLNDRAYYLKHHEKIKAYVKAWKAERPGYGAEGKKAWREENPTYGREWYLANRERVLVQNREYRERRLHEMPEHVRALGRNSTARRRAKEREAYVEHVDPRIVWERDRGICQICGNGADSKAWHLDHIVPIARGGEHSYANVQVAHPLCNRRKAAR